MLAKWDQEKNIFSPQPQHLGTVEIDGKLYKVQYKVNAYWVKTGKCAIRSADSEPEIISNQELCQKSRFLNLDEVNYRLEEIEKIPEKIIESWIPYQYPVQRVPGGNCD